MNREQALKILEIDNEVDNNTLKKIFRRQALRYHPDKNKDIKAAETFIMIVRAYELLNSDKTQERKKEFSRPKFRSNYSKNEQFEYAKKKFKENERKLYEYEFRKYKSSYKRKLSVLSAIIGVILGILLLADNYLPYQTKIYNLSELQFEKHVDAFSKEVFFKIDNQTFHTSLNNFINLQTIKPKIEATQTQLFNEITEINFKIDNQNSICIIDSSSIHNTFPFIFLLLLIPLASLFVERANVYFLLFTVYYNIYVVPIIILIILFHDLRIIRLINTIHLLLIN